MNKRRKEIVGVVLMSIALICILSILLYIPTEDPGGYTAKSENWLGEFGVYAGNYLYKFIFGYYTIFLFIIIFLIGFSLFANKSIKNQLQIYLYLFFTSIWCALFTAYLGANDYSGIIGYAVFKFLNGIFHKATLLIIAVTFFLLLSGIFKFSLYDTLKKIIIPFKYLLNKIKNFRTKKKIEIHRESNYKDNNLDNFEESSEILESEIDDNLNDETTEETLESEAENSDENNITSDNDNLEENNIDDNTENLVIEEEIKVTEGNFEKENKTKLFNYKLPKIDYLETPIEIHNHDEDYLKQKADELIYALDSFGVSGNVVKISPGPVVTLYEIEPAEGVRVNKFTTLSEDLSRIMGGKRVRIIAPIPGSKSVGIELPNESPSIVYLKSIINSKIFLDNHSKLKIALGKTTTGDAFIFELDKMPHLLVAGATGAGKSVCINTIIISILYNAKPNEVKFILMDPKKVELSTYKSLVGYHLITAPNLDEYVMTTSENAVGILESAISEMEDRFQIFSETRVRNIKEYQEKRSKNDSLKEIPYIIVIIDELSDLMMTSGRAIEEPITRLAQKARAVGIHLIVATQRPSVDVITGLIKANFPARISFQVSSRVDSRTIIDQIGAEKLLGRGDMLFLLPGTAFPIRLHNAFITLKEIEKVMNHISTQSKPDEIKLPEIKKNQSGNGFTVNERSDELLYDAAKLVVDYKQASVSLLQRKFRIGYSRAGRLIDELESLGIITGHSGSKAREVLVDHSYLKEIFND